MDRAFLPKVLIFCMGGRMQEGRVILQLEGWSHALKITSAELRRQSCYVNTRHEALGQRRPAVRREIPPSGGFAGARGGPGLVNGRLPVPPRDVQERVRDARQGRANCHDNSAPVVPPVGASLSSALVIDASLDGRGSDAFSGERRNQSPQ
ncbi:hypothetical protein ABB37_04626 [Leptomonas pyrrhocoris]|uniref:Uncharacterized protein n=1 Tax=Leptomonas pyrrhocoris TaxID=157538 RepID=A0A0M9G1N6_LEPPY|nr:hypothetical protein ABB37_04620 [Leptomonas pyrrhocoris]XP_015658799.1 hypothetical protein ABB37_04620 [Leptomonas pyrrhocoris]XP_015658801.1 hypothetical protein ABB37_04622 [Leptomonas pyrrhocoris]XP_015658802.1 hypothetical protein ABB37_04622 [Leptomonas pyrrhocoris]XP_015658804.1 hypothetical protein ABB37_04624 [Leptomonas pyrrhocoris]XP_015658805.1 hypothetical protein ABB37_04624 [Leptomonas pyrrhocoris]XP_015658807.1 hypothetical protein ABB37_04626 [Leptomonas pyrrhocoris]XP_0|eukprot:XP_015658798.1 hypothetical protein ABB37_04620 [Leptomonas pyrrhocoris]